MILFDSVSHRFLQWLKRFYLSVTDWHTYSQYKYFCSKLLQNSCTNLVQNLCCIVIDAPIFAVQKIKLFIHLQIYKKFWKQPLYFLGNFLASFCIFFSSLATRRSTFLMSSAGGSSSGLMPRWFNIPRTLRLFCTCSAVMLVSP